MLKLGALVLLAAVAAWFFRRVLLTPWARYVRHVVIKPNERERYFLLTVKRILWYPPFSDLEEVWASKNGEIWTRETDGMTLTQKHNQCLSNMISVAMIRELELAQLIKDE